MASEPKRPIEEMLEASAKARRDAFGVDPQMPNPMRARLHDEIARRQDAEPDQSPSWLQMFWPRLAVAAALATVLVIAPVMWWRESDRNAMQVAGPDSSSASQAKETSADELLAKGPAAAAPSAPNVSLADNDRTTLQSEQTPASVAAETSTDGELLAEAPAAAAPPMVTKGLITKEGAESDANATVAGAAAPVAARAKARTNEGRQAAASIAQRDQAAEASRAAPLGADAVPAKPGLTQRFAQQNAAQNFRNTVQRRQVANILTNFEVQQEGNEIRLVDSDGSTYTGRLEQTEKLKERAAKRSDRSEDAKAGAVATRFRATGFNMSLRKSLVFEGNYSQTPEEEKSPNDSTKSEARRVEAARIVGTARVAGEPPVEVDARPVPVEKFER